MYYRTREVLDRYIVLSDTELEAMPLIFEGNNRKASEQYERVLGWQTPNETQKGEACLVTQSVVVHSDTANSRNGTVATCRVVRGINLDTWQWAGLWINCYAEA